jgi:Predicted metal-dependent hydrolase of the TIM-barrel fold
MPFTLYYNPKLVVEEGKLQPSGLENFPYEAENKALLYEVGLSSGHFIPFLAIDPKEKVEKQIKFLKATKGYFGLKLHTIATHSSIEDLENSPFLEVLQERDIPIILHSGREKNALSITILRFAKRHPNIRICIAHLAGFDSLVFSQIVSIPNLFIDTSPFLVCCNLAARHDLGYLADQSLELDYSNPAEVLVSVYGLIKDHIIWGTDEPWTTIYRSKNRKDNN